MGAVRNPNKPAEEQNFEEMSALASRKESLKDSIQR
jgi:hypothetical protein